MCWTLNSNTKAAAQLPEEIPTSFAPHPLVVAGEGACATLLVDCGITSGVRAWVVGIGTSRHRPLPLWGPCTCTQFNPPQPQYSGVVDVSQNASYSPDLRTAAYCLSCHADTKGNGIARTSQHTHSTKPCVPKAILGKTKANLRSKGKNKRQIAFLPTPPSI